jgi:hypothetical protein
LRAAAGFVYRHPIILASSLTPQFAQVVTQIGPVLDLEFPDGIQRILNALKPLAIDLQSILQLDCLAGSDFTFYAFWVIRCFLLPGLMLAAVGVQYVYERRRVDHATAMGYLKANAFVVIFLCYVSFLSVLCIPHRKVLIGVLLFSRKPGVCNQAFSMFNCRDLDGGLSVLHKDYSISCSTDRHAAFELIAAAYVACVSLGIPLCMVRNSSCA